MAAPGPWSNLKTNVNRKVTRKWKDAKNVSYDGGDWGDDDEYDEPVPVSAGNARHPGWGPQSNVYPSNPSVTDPSPSRSGGRPSFDRGDERRHFSPSPGFDSAYPTTQPSPFPEPQHDYDPPASSYREQPSLRVNTQPQGPTPPGAFRPGSRGRQYPPSSDVPFSAPGSFPQQRRSGSSNRPTQGDMYQRHESPMRPDSRGSNASARQFPPRKQSLSQPLPPADFSRGHEPIAPPQAPVASESSEDRPIPAFIRPSDIYKRMDEEMEKVRKSQESSRPSIDSGTSRARESSVGARSTSSDPKDVTNSIPQPSEDSDSTRRLKPTLDTVPERKSEYGLENMLQTSGGTQPAEDNLAADGPAGVSRHPTTASSVYTDRPDPVSASTVSRNASLNESIPEGGSLPSVRPGLELPRMSGFGIDLGGTGELMSENVPDETESLPRRPTRPPKADSANDERREEPILPSLQHQPSLGYRSVVQQAFDESEHQQPFSPTSTSGTVDRSNSASTSDISPIIGRKQDSAPAAFASQSTYAIIPEESSQTESRPTSTGTLTVKEAQVQEVGDISPPAPIRTGYRRDVTPPSRDNMPAKKPLSVEPSVRPQPQHGSLVDEGEGEAAGGEEPRGRITKDKPLPTVPTTEAATSDSSMPPTEQTTSEEWKERQTHTAKHNDQAGFQKSDPSTPHIPSSIHRSESPSKGTRRDLAGRLESQSGRSSPNNPNVHITSPSSGESRPAPQSKLESFHPSVPGGLQSFSSTPAVQAPDSSTPSQRHGEVLRPPQSSRPGMLDSTESVPAANSASSSISQGHGVTRKAFAAAATAGSTLAGASTGQRLAQERQQSQDPSEDSSENERDTSSASRRDHPNPVLTHAPPIEQSHEEKPGISDTPSAPSQPSAQPSLGHPSSVSASTPLSNAAPNEDDISRSTLDYVPAPLRTSKALDTSVGRTSIPGLSIPQESPADGDNERLRLEIVKSLTPKSSGFTGETGDHNMHANSSQSTQNRDLADTEVDFMRTTSEKTPIPQPKDSSVPNINSNLATDEQAPPPIDEAASNVGKPLLQHRFSWETGSEQPPPAPTSVSTPKQQTSPSTGSPDTIRARIQPMTSAMETAGQGPDLGRGLDREAAMPAQSALPSEVSNIAVTESHATPPVRQSTMEAASFRAIMNLKTPQERLMAFDESRRLYAMPDGQLEGLLLSMKTSEHSELFAMNGRISQDTTENVIPHKPSPRRLLTESTPARHMQEDGKRLMAAAGRFGGKAGSAAKGFFAKGKEKMRNASSGEKGLLTNRRKSTGPSTTEPENIPSQSQPRDSTFLEGLPPIPLTTSPISPSDWFSKPDLQRSQDSDLQRTIQPQGAASSTVSVGQETDKSQARHVEEIPTGPVGSSVAVLPLSAPASPTISALESEHHDGARIPSRSISQVTRPTAECSPVESPHRGNLEQITAREDTVSQSRRAPDDHDDPAMNVLTAPGLLGRHLDGSKSDVHSNDRSLNVPRNNRRSLVSDVSSASPSPGPGAPSLQLRRSVSPTDEESRRPEANVHEQADIHTPPPPPPAISSPSDIKARISEQPNLDAADETMEPHRKEILPPGIDEPYAMRQDVKPKVETVEAAAPGETQWPQPEYGYEGQSQTQTRPFSFAGLEGVGEIHQSQQLQVSDLSIFPTSSMSPVNQKLSNQRLSQEISQVSVDEVTGPSNSFGQQQSSPYSRPSGVDSNVRDHPPFRTPEPEQPPMNRTQQYSSGSPLPSARRPREELDRLRQLKEQQQQHTSLQQTQPTEEEEREEDYRIPGPYVQEYRSPKQISTPKVGRSQTQVQASGQPLPSALRSQQYPVLPPHLARPAQQSARASYPVRESTYQGHPDYRSHMGHVPDPDTLYQYDLKPEVDLQPMGLPPSPAPQPTTAAPATGDSKASKKSTWGGLFGGTSKSRSKLQNQNRAETPLGEQGGQQKEKRASMFRRNSQHDSISSQQSGQYRGQDRVGQLPPSNIPSHSARRQSRDVLMTPTPESAQLPPDGRKKKKRFSGIGNRLFKSSSISRASTTPMPSTQNPLTTTSRQVELQHPSQSVMSPQSYSNQNLYGQFPSGPRGYVHQDSREPRSTQSAYAQYSTHQHASDYPRVASPYQHQSQPVDYPYSSMSSQAQPPQAPRLYPSNTYPYLNTEQRRPSDLRIDTSGSNGNLYGMPATASALIYPPHDTSFASGAAAGSYNPSPSPVPDRGASSAASVTPARRQPTPTQQDPRAHVIDLHKRSRSPRLGRRSSSEDLNAQRQQEGQNPAQVSAPGAGGPVSKLGTFSSKKISPVGGIPRGEDDQERPYAIGIPGLDEEDDRKKKLRERIEGANASGRSETPVSVESMGTGTVGPMSGTLLGGGLDRNMNVLEDTHDNSSNDAKRNARDKNSGFIAELPGSRAEGYESEEEIPMSATAYPGQEWMPVFVNDGRWDD
ncbi:uncharacterized protein Z518_07896 [Rhinocladiella mackenziei CBS 650.93]|uniref:Uncharacterized protein n=1 Tax=Rhinocladiella mackenziei CBS 650.93 TaxID=1442369 RepID=A0A0D2FJ01_9EURO|nr:uncharacterized protein Z518_07896 [Rhinocladiella mackenziei CBS 650.93]KIX01957.1 hypothetical protein Z518_07896 [Rhinocladiella mackenziei CBS 650.93]